MRRRSEPRGYLLGRSQETPSDHDLGREVSKRNRPRNLSESTRLPVAPFQPFTPQALRRGYFSFRRAFLFRTWRLEGGRKSLEAGLGEEGREAAFAHLAFADVGVAVEAGA